MKDDSEDPKLGSDGVRGYRDLRVWQESMGIAKDVYRLSQTFPKSEIYGITQQMRRAAVSIPSNIAEGQGRRSTREFLHFCGVAKGSASELQTQVLLAYSFEFLSEDDYITLDDKLDSVGGMLRRLQEALERKLDEQA